MSYLDELYQLDGKIALVTGAGQGIGEAIALALMRCGATAILAGRTESKLVQVERKAKEFGGNCAVRKMDIADPKEIDEGFAWIEKTYGRLDILVNNAGMALSRSFEETTMAEFDRIMALNARVPYLACHLALPLLRCSECASILNIASVVAHKGYPLQSAYAASKHALAGFTKSLASEVYREDIRVHLISPGGVFTDMVRIARPDLTGEDMILPEDIAEIAAFFIEHRTNAVIDEICVHRSGKEPFL